MFEKVLIVGATSEYIILQCGHLEEILGTLRSNNTDGNERVKNP